MEVRENDVFSIGFPKSGYYIHTIGTNYLSILINAESIFKGTTWLEEILWLLLNDFDFEKARSIHHYYRVTIVDSGHSKRLLSEIPSPRLFKSHLPLKFLPESLSKRAKVYRLLF